MGAECKVHDVQRNLGERGRGTQPVRGWELVALWLLVMRTLPWREGIRYRAY